MFLGRLFGTDGIRGIANEQLSCEMAINIGRAAAQVLSDSMRRRPRFVVGMDTRISSGMLAYSVIAGLCSVGADVFDLGVAATPSVAFCVGKYKAEAGIMVSASHNTFEYNGIKIFNGDGYKLPDELEEEIERLVIEKNQSLRIVTGIDIGFTEFRESAVKDYIDNLKSTVQNSLDGLRIAVDCANGSASVTAARLFGELGAECFVLFNKPDGRNINGGCGSTHPEALIEYVVEHNLDAGIAFDGDADRCLCIDEKGALIDGDVIMAICALDMKNRGKLSKNTVVGTIMTNYGFIKFCDKNGIKFVTTKVGDKFVLEQLALEDFNFGGEQSGHIIFRDFASTGDGQLTAVQLLSLLRRKGCQLSELASCIKKFPQIMQNVPVPPHGKISIHTDQAIKEELESIKTQIGDNGRLVIRASGTEPLIRVMVEHKSIKAAEAFAAQGVDIISRSIM